MLDTFRKASQSWFIKILFGLLIISFVVFFGNSSELLRLSSSRPAIVVGHQEISAGEVAEEFRRDTDRLGSMFQTRITTEQARQMGLLQQTIQQMVSRALLSQAANDLKFTLDDDSLRRMIANTPSFQNQLKVFDKAVYQNVLRRVGLSEAAFVRMSRDDAMRQDLVRLIQSGVAAPNAETDPLFRYRYERRVADTIGVAADKMPRAAKADEAQLKTYWSAHPELFTAPELRGFTAVVVRLADVAAGIHPSEADINAAYQVRQGEFQTPERRAIKQVVFSDQAQAQAFAEQVKQAGSFDAAAKQAGKDVVDLGLVERKALPLSQLADAAFALAAPGVSAPTETPLGWHVLAVTAIQAGKTQPLAEVRDRIVKGLVKDEATNRLFALSTKLEDAIGSGAPVEEAAQTLQVPPLKIAAMDARGLGADGKPIPGAPDSQIFRQALFQAAQGATSDVKPLEGEGGYFVLHVDAANPPALKPFESVRDQVLAAWSQEDRAQAAHRQAEALRDRLQKGEPMAQVAKGFTLSTTAPFRRASDDEAKDVPPLLAAEMFKAAPDGLAVVDVPGGSLVARLKQVIPADPAKDEAAYVQTRTQLSQSMAADLMQQYLGALQKDYGVSVREALIERQLEGAR